MSECIRGCIPEPGEAAGHRGLIHGSASPGSALLKSVVPIWREDRVFSVRQEGLAEAPSILQLHHIKLLNALIEIV